MLSKGQSGTKDMQKSFRYHQKKVGLRNPPGVTRGAKGSETMNGESLSRTIAEGGNKHGEREISCLGLRTRWKRAKWRQRGIFQHQGQSPDKKG